MPLHFYPDPQNQDEYASNFQIARLNVAQSLGFPFVNGTVDEFKALSAAQQIQLEEALAKYILDGRTQFFSPQTVDLARRQINAPAYGTPLEDTSLFTSVGDFATEYASSVASKATLILVLGLVAALAFAILPGAIAKARAE